MSDVPLQSSILDKVYPFIPEHHSNVNVE